MNFMGNNPILSLILLFVFTGGDEFDTTQLLLALALFSTVDSDDNGCPRPNNCCPRPNDGCPRSTDRCPGRNTI